MIIFQTKLEQFFFPSQILDNGNLRCLVSIFTLYKPSASGCVCWIKKKYIISYLCIIQIFKGWKILLTQGNNQTTH